MIRRHNFNAPSYMALIRDIEIMAIFTNRSVAEHRRTSRLSLIKTFCQVFMIEYGNWVDSSCAAAH